MPAVGQLDPCRAAVPRKAAVDAGNKLCAGAVQQAELSVPADDCIAAQQRRGAGKDQRLVCIVVGPVYAVVAGGGHFMARCVQIHPFALALGGGQRRVKEAVSRGVYKIVGCIAVPAAIHVQPVADEVVPFVAFVRGGAALRGHKAVGAAAEQPQDVVGERNELARPHAAAVQVGFIVLQTDKLPVAAAVVFCTKASVAALCQHL